MNTTALKSLYIRFGPFIRFCLVGASGIIVNTAALWVITSVFGVSNLAFSLVLSTLASSAWNCLLTELWVFGPQDKQSSWVRRAVPFFLLNVVLALVVRAPIVAWLTADLHVVLALANLISLVLLVVVRYLVARFLIWRARVSMPPPAPAAATVD